MGRRAVGAAGEPVQRRRHPDREIGPRLTQGRPGRGSEPARPVGLPGPGQCGRGLQQQRQYGGQRIGGNGGFRRVHWRGLLGAAVHGGQQRGQVGALAGQQRREQDVVFLRHVPGKQPGYLFRALCRAGGACRLGKPPGRLRQDRVLGGHLADGAGQAVECGGRRVDGGFLGRRVRKDLPGEIGDQPGDGRLMRLARCRCRRYRAHPVAELLAEDPVMGPHCLVRLGSRDRHVISLLRPLTAEHYDSITSIYNTG